MCMDLLGLEIEAVNEKLLFRREGGERGNPSLVLSGGALGIWLETEPTAEEIHDYGVDTGGFRSSDGFQVFGQICGETEACPAPGFSIIRGNWCHSCSSVHGVPHHKYTKE